MARNAGQLLPSLLACALYSIPVMVVQALMVPTRSGEGRIRRNLRRAATALMFALCIGCAASAASYTRQGYVLWHRGDYDAAVSAFDQALKAHPDDAEAYYGRGRAHGAAGQYNFSLAAQAGADLEFNLLIHH